MYTDYAYIFILASHHFIGAHGGVNLSFGWSTFLLSDSVSFQITRLRWARFNFQFTKHKFSIWGLRQRLDIGILLMWCDYFCLFLCIGEEPKPSGGT